MASEKEPNNQDHPAKAENQTQAHKDIGSIRVDIHRFVEDEQTREDKRDADAQRKFRWERRTAIGVWIYTILTMGALIVSIYTSHRQHADTMTAIKQARDAASSQHSDTMKVLADSNTNAAQQHADTSAALAKADTANQIAQDTAKRQLRAYLIVSESFIKVDKRTNLVSATAVIKNVGLTPAYDFSGWACLYVGRFFNDGNTVKVETIFPNGNPRIQKAQRTIIGPGQTKQPWGPFFCDGKGSTNRPLLPSEITRLQAGRAAIYLYGRETYTDAFGDPRWITFRVFNNDYIGLTPNGFTLDTINGNQGN